MKKFEVIEDNGGGITLAVFNNDGRVEYIHSGFEYSEGGVAAALQDLKDGDDPVRDWDGNCGGSPNEYGTDPQAIYDQFTSFEYGWEVVADNDGIYADKMGAEACRQFGIED